MTRGFAWLTAALTATVGLLVGMVVSGSLSPTAALSAPPVVARPAASSLAAAPLLGPVAIPGVVNFADIADKLNPVVVNIDASAPGGRARPPAIHAAVRIPWMNRPTSVVLVATRRRAAVLVPGSSSTSRG